MGLRLAGIVGRRIGATWSNTLDVVERSTDYYFDHGSLTVPTKFTVDQQDARYAAASLSHPRPQCKTQKNGKNGTALGQCFG